MNCTKCSYLLWDLRECRCPECAEPFDVTHYAFQPACVHFACPHCEQHYLGMDDMGLPSPRRFDCLRCRESVDVATMSVHPLTDDAFGEPQIHGTPWDYRDRVGFLPALLDGVARLATQPGEYFRRATRSRGSQLFSILCAYLSAAVSIALFAFLIKGHVIGAASSAAFLADPRFWIGLAIGVPVVQIAWNYMYGFFIFAVLKLLGLPSGDFDRSVHAVAYGSAVLPALFLLPPVGLPWYINVVSSGVEHFNGTTRGRAVLAAIVPLLLAGNLVLCFLFATYLA